MQPPQMPPGSTPPGTAAVQIEPNTQADILNLANALGIPPQQVLNELLSLALASARAEQLRRKYCIGLAIHFGEAPRADAATPPSDARPKDATPPEQDNSTALERLNAARAEAGLPPLGGVTETEN